MNKAKLLGWAWVIGITLAYLAQFREILPQILGVISR